MRYSSLFLFFAAILLCIGEQSHARPTVEEVTSNPSNAVLAADWGNAIYDAMETYLAADGMGNPRGWRLGIYPDNPSGAYIGWGQAPIQLEPSDVRFGRARIAAYTVAYMNAIADLTRTVGMEIGSDTLQREFGDEAALAEFDAEATDSFMRAMLDRVSTLSIAALDRGLERLGADPEQLPRYTRDQKVLLAESLLTREIIRGATARLQGVRTLATFEDTGEVGVLIIHHVRLEELAGRVLAGEVLSREPAQIDDILASIESMSDSELIFQHGLRVIADAQGDPVLISFGQASPAVSRSDSNQAIRMAVSRSRQIAEAQADAALAEFLNATVFANSVAELTAGEFQIAEQVGRDMLTREGNQFMDDINTMIRQVARAEVTGLTTIRRWQANHPDTGHLYTGIVRLWTPSQNFAYSAQSRQEALEAVRGDALSDADESHGDEEDDLDAPVRQSREVFREDW